MNSRLLTSIIDFLPDAILVANHEGRVIAWNKAMERMTGVAREDILGAGDFAYAIPFYGEKRPILIDMVRGRNGYLETFYDYVKTRGSTVYAETYVPTMIGGKGAYLWGIATPLLDGDGRYLGAIESIRDITERKQMEEELRFRNVLLSTQQESSLDGILVIDGKDRIVSLNNQLARMFAIPPDARPGASEILAWQPIVERLEDSDETKEKIGHLSTHHSETSREEIILKDGRTLDCYSAPMPGPDGKNYGRVWYFRDITARKRAEQALQESEEKFRLLFEKSADPVLLIDGTRYIDCNEAAVRMLGGTGKECLIGLTPCDISPERQPDGRLSSERVRELLDIAFAQGSTRFEWVRRTFDDTAIWTESSLTVIPIQGRKIFHAVWRDIMEQKLAEARLKRETQFNSTLIQDSPAFFVAMAPDGKILLMNRSLCNALGYTAKEVIGKECLSALVPPEERKMVREVFDTLSIEREPTLNENHILGKNGRRRLVEWHGRPVIDEKNDLEFFFEVGIDITARKQAEEALKKRELELEVKSKNLEEVNTALKVLLQHRENDKAELEEKILSNLKTLVLPHIDKLKKSRLESRHMMFLEMIETNLRDIISPFLQRMNSCLMHFTHTELEIANLIKAGKRTKEIGDLLHISPGTVKFHRNNIRKKLGLNNEKANLRSHLLSLSGL